MSFRQTRSDREPARRRMSSSIRPGAAAGAGGTLSRSGIRPPTRSSVISKPASSYSRNGPVSPTGSVASVMTNGMKRKEREFDVPEVEIGGEATNINVVVRCRGRNEREVRENSAVMVKTDATKGKIVELSMGANALSNKSYNFDRVFSQAADQSMIFEDTVKPILDEMLAGYNCTIFAYGQTGTGKTYTMSGDMTETMGMLSDEAGIIPRVLHQLFNKLEVEETEHCVKCSFIELYNEELRDLLSVDDSVKLKIYDDASKRGHLSTIVQGMEEKHIQNSAEGIKVLQNGSLKRQVAATKCNDLSSRSHTVFTITAYVKKTNENGVEDFVSAGKLNLVDLAGSENIQRSGAENKRAAEAGLINKSLLTLGRVINALVDRSAHIPYRESKLTRLLQDSLGGRTKTCIIATISPAKSNIEETISTLEYAFRAKNIKNKPQMNPMLNKKTLLKEFTIEIERLKSELIATRQRNGVYLSNDAYEEMTAQSESRRIVMEEQAAKMETLETNLRNKVQELFSLTSNFMGLKKDHEGTKSQLDDTKGILDQTEVVLSATRQSLATETELRMAHEETENKLAAIGDDLIKKLDQTVGHVSGLHAKDKRKSDLQSLNRVAWGVSQGQVGDVTTMVERRIDEFQKEQREHMANVSRRMEAFVGEELKKLSATQTFLDEQLDVFGNSKKQLLQRKNKSKDDMDKVLEEIKEIRDSVQERVGDSLQAISRAAEKIAADVVSEMGTFHDQLHTSYSTLGKDFRTIFEDLVKHMTAQRCESESLKRQVESATSTLVLQNSSMSTQMLQALEEERRQAAEDRQRLMIQISSLVSSQAEAQESRMEELLSNVQKGMSNSGHSLEEAVLQYTQGMDNWDEKEGQMLDEVKRTRDRLKNKLKDDWNMADNRGTAIQNTARSVHAETIRVVDEQVQDLDVQMGALDDFVTRAKTENASHHDAHSQSVKAVSNTVEQSFSNISSHYKTTFERVMNLGEEMELDMKDLSDTLGPLDTQLCQPLANLREEISNAVLQEYQSTGETPQKMQYQYPRTLPRTRTPGKRQSILDESNDQADEDQGLDTTDLERITSSHEDTCNTTIVFADLPETKATTSSPTRASTSSSIPTPQRDKTAPLPSQTSLREVNPNVATTNLTSAAAALVANAASSNHSGPSVVDIAHAEIAPADNASMPLLKHSTRTTRGLKKLGEGRENIPLSALSQTFPKRKSPRLN